MGPELIKVPIRHMLSYFIYILSGVQCRHRHSIFALMLEVFRDLQFCDWCYITFFPNYIIYLNLIIEFNIYLIILIFF